MPYVTTRWLGGTLTNFQTIEGRIDYLVRLEDRYQRGELSILIKKEAGKLIQEMEKMNRYFGGIKGMRRLPGALFIVDPPMERIAVTEAMRMRIPIIAMCDTNSDPDEIDYPIPSNDDAIRAVKLIASKIADAALEGRNLRATRRRRTTPRASTWRRSPHPGASRHRRTIRRRPRPRPKSHQPPRPPAPDRPASLRQEQDRREEGRRWQWPFQQRT